MTVGRRTIGIAGGTEKCRWLTEVAHFDASVDYKAGAVGKQLRALCPKGIDVYFDNVGGEILDAALALLAQRARVVLCGGISGYNEVTPPPGPRNIMNLVIQRARMERFIAIDYARRFAEGRAELSRGLDAREIVHQGDALDGIGNWALIIVGWP